MGVRVLPSVGRSSSECIAGELDRYHSAQKGTFSPLPSASLNSPFFEVTIFANFSLFSASENFFSPSQFFWKN